MKIRFGAKENSEIRKGPWKAEEDEVLMNHVKKYGPRDWSSIRSKGLLLRTGKSCRLRWVNKLRPNLKNGCKFSLEEERIVIELQGQFGNKWARIATYLQGRTDNDVKNFWSSRQKRLARILQSSVAPPPSSKSHKNSNNRQVVVFHHVPNMLAPKLNLVADEESSSKASCSSASTSSHFENSEMIKMVPLPSLVNPVNFEANMSHLNYFFNNQNPCNDNEYQTHVTFPQIPKLEQELPMFSPESQQFVAQFDDPNLLDIFSPGNLGPDDFFDDFPTDMFDHIEPLPSPSEW